MEFIYGLNNLRRQRKNCAATIGNFDGIHLGHQLILEQLKQIHQKLGVLSHWFLSLSTYESPNLEYHPFFLQALEFQSEKHCFF